jgi:tetratricopeptide (TPR) repeat protein
VLARLVAKSLVAAGEVDGEWRYDLLDTMAAYAGERLSDAGETDELARRHSAWATGLARREGTSPRLDPEAANLRRALSNSLASDPHAALRLCVAVWPFWLRRIDLGEAQRRFAAALDAAPERSALRIEALRAAAAIDFRAGTLRSGSERAEEAYEIAAELGDARAEWRALQFLVELAVAIDDPDKAAEWVERGLVLARREGYAAGEAVSIYTLGVARWLSGDLEGADMLLAESLVRFRELESGEEPIPSLLNIAEVRTDDPADVSSRRVVFEDTLQPFVELSSSGATGYVLANQATIARLRGDVDRARALLDASAARFDDLGDQRGEASVLARRAFLQLEEGDVEGARSCLEHALGIRSNLNDRRGVGLALTGLGLVDTVAGDFERAERELTEACELFRRAGDRWGLSSSLWRVADLARVRGRLDDAWAALEDARRVVSETGRHRWLGHTDAALAEVALLKGDRELALSLLATARDEYAAAKDEHGVAVVEHRLSETAKTTQRARKGSSGTNGRKRPAKGRPR